MTLQVHAPSLPELFERLTYQYFDALLPLEEIGAAIREKVVAEAPDPETLLQVWLKNLISLTVVDGMVFREVHILAFKADAGQPCQIRAEAIGELVDAKRHNFKIRPMKLAKPQVILQNTPPDLFARIIFSEKP